MDDLPIMLSYCPSFTNGAIDTDRSIPVVPKSHDCVLTDKELVDYKDRRVRFLSWLFQVGKHPGKAEGYSPDVRGVPEREVTGMNKKEQLAKLHELEDRLYEIAEERGVDLPPRDRENLKTYETTRPVHGEARLHSETVQYESPEPETYTEEVTIPAPMQDPDEAETRTVERKHHRPSFEDVVEHSSDSYLNEGGTEDSDIPAPGEVYRERSDE